MVESDCVATSSDERWSMAADSRRCSLLRTVGVRVGGMAASICSLEDGDDGEQADGGDEISMNEFNGGGLGLSKGRGKDKAENAETARKAFAGSLSGLC